MAVLNRPIKNVLVLGATGNIGRPIINSLLAHSSGFKITAVTRTPSQASLPPSVKVTSTDFSDVSLRELFRGQDAIIASLPVPQVAEQHRYIDIAIECGVVRFIPSEFGMDTLKPEAVQWRPKLIEKVKILNYLKEKESELTWTAFITGGFFDWAMEMSPGGFGFTIPSRKATIYDGGDVEFEVTNLARIGAAVANSLSPEYQALAANKVAYINSFDHLTQNRILAGLEKQLGQKFEIEEDTKEAYRERAAERLKKDPTDMSAALDMATVSIMGLGGINQYSKERELWNRKLGLREESLEETIERVLKGYK